MKRPLIAFLVFALIALGVFGFWPRADGSRPAGSVIDVIARILDKPDTALLRRLERDRVVFDSAWRANARAVQAMQDAYRDSLATAQAKQIAAEVRTARQKAKADSIARVLAATRDDDDSLPRLVALVAAKDSVIVAVTGERDAAMGRVSVLERAVEARDSALAMYRNSLNEAIRQRNAYRGFGPKSLVRAGAVLLATVAVCRSVPEPC